MPKGNDTVEVPTAELVAMIRDLRAELAELRQQTRVNTEAVLNSKALILDPQYEAWKKEAARPASERTQDAAAARWTEGRPFRCRFDAKKDDGKPVDLREHFPLVIRANSPEEAGARYLIIMGITKSDYRVIAEPCDPLPAAA